MSLVARYFFDLYNDVNTSDDEGRDFPDLAAAKDNALAEAKEMMTQSVHDGALDLNHHIDVRDEGGKVVYVLRFADAVRIIPERRPS